MKPVINKSCEKIINSLVKNMPQSLLITGPDGVGLGTIAKYIASHIDTKPTIILPEKDDKIDTNSGVISIEIMRKLYDESRSKLSNARVIIIDYAEKMTIQAQNAFLKLLEEPNDNLYFILVSHSIAKILPTITSRATRVDIKPITAEQSNKLLDDLDVKDAKKRTQILFIANGLPAEISRLVADETYFNAQSNLMRDARDLLQASQYQKLIIANKYKDDRALALQLLSDCMKILKTSIIEKPDILTVKRIDAVLTAYQQIESNGNIRLCIARMII